MIQNKTAIRLNRILSMLPWVIANRGTSVEEVCERFGYSPSELAKDLDLVFVCGLPGYGPGELMEAYIDGDQVVVDMADYFSKPVRLNPAEALGLLAAGMALGSTDQAPPALERAVEKLAAAVLGDTEDVLAVELAAAPGSLDDLRRAAIDHRVVEFTYTSLGKGETKSRVVEPWSVFSSLGNWYLSGHCRTADAERIFRLDRIRDLVAISEVFEPPADLPVPEVRYTPGEDDIYATLKLGPASRWVAEYYPVEIVSDDEDSLVVRFAASTPAVVARLLIRLGVDAELVEGEEVAIEAERLREAILARYRPSIPV
ncbi:MAG TPA: WYL domain-containing protein [Actinobacteria bacterium]|nr:WYL domain-containing protein [Actinomycetota bacterium]